MTISALTICLLFLASCGKSIKNAQDFEPNRPPRIDTLYITVTLADGSPLQKDKLVAGMSAIRIFVPATDPDKDPLTYEFTSPYGSFSDKSISNDGCAIIFYISSNINGGVPVPVHIIVQDPKKASSTVDYTIGTGKVGANISVSVTGSAYIQPGKDSEITFSADCEGMYQIYCDNTVSLPANAVMRDDLPIFRYKKDSNGAFQPMKLSISGPGSLTAGKAKLSAINSSNAVWVVFSDNINPDISIKCTITVDDTAPFIISRNPASGATGIDSSTAIITIGFSEPVIKSLLEKVTLNSGGTNLSLTLKSYSESDYTAVYSVEGSLGYLRNYTIDASGITDLAGNPLSNSTFSFTTKEAGQLTAPQASISDGQIFDAATTVTLNSLEGGSIRYTLDGSNPSSTTGTVYSGPVSISVNTKITAIAYGVSGYTDSATSAVICKIRAPKPKLTYTTDSYGDNIITITPPTSGTIYYTTNEDPPDTSLTPYTSAQTFPAAGNVRNGADIIVKAIATKTNMEQSSIESAEYIVTYPSVGAITYSLAPGTYSSAKSGTITISSAPSGYTAKYTIDGSNPEGSGGKLCSSGQSIYNSFSQTLKISMFKERYSDSSFSRTFIINNPLFIYVANNGSNSLSCFAQTSAGTLEALPSSPVSVGYAPYMIEAHPVAGANFIYVTDTTNNKIHSYSFDSAGRLSELNSLATGLSPVATTSYSYNYTNGGIPTTTNCIYVCNQGSDSVSGYSIGTDGKLTSLTNSPWSVKPTGVSISYSPVSVAIAQGIYYHEDTAALYSANSSSNNLSYMHLDLKGGGLYNIQTSALYGTGFSPRVITSGYFYDATTPYSWFSIGGASSSDQIQNFWMDNSDNPSNGLLSYCGQYNTTYSATSLAANPQIYNTNTTFMACTAGDSSSGIIYCYDISYSEMNDDVSFTPWSNSINLASYNYGRDPGSIKISADSDRIYFVNRVSNTFSTYYIGNAPISGSTIGSPTFNPCGNLPKSLVVKKGFF
jgi:6-phosphogluconolactonase (cycloisomerase 2 family)